MTLDVTSRQAEIEELSRRYRVSTLYLFGSAAKGTMHEESDLDFLVEFDNPVVPGYANRYFGLIDGLEELFGREVHLVTASTVRNPFLKRSIEQSKVLLYAA